MKMLLAPLLLGLTLSRYAEAAPPMNGGHRIDMPSILPVDARCELSLGNRFIDFGTKSLWQLQDAPTGHDSVTFGKRTLMLNVACPYTQAIGLTLRGERAANGDLRYGDRGVMVIRMFDAQVDGQSVQMLSTTANGLSSSTATNSLLLQPGQSVTASKNGQPAKGKTFTARFEIEPMLPKKDAHVSAHQSNKANLTLELME